MAPTRSAFSVKPHSTPANCACFLRFSLEIGPHPGQGVLDKECWCFVVEPGPTGRQSRSSCISFAGETLPTLVEDGLVESGFLLDVPAGLFDSAGGRSGHIAHLEILHHNHRVVFADGGVDVLCRKSRPTLAMRA
jgi:hypothetical protein